MWNIKHPWVYPAGLAAIVIIWIASLLWSHVMEAKQLNTWQQDHGRSAPLVRLLEPDRPNAPPPVAEPESAAAGADAVRQAPPPPAMQPAPSGSVPTAPPSPPAPIFPPHQPTTPSQAEQAAAAGCIPGAKIAVRRSTDFFVAGGQPTARADIGDAMTVAAKNPVSGDRCNVLFDDPSTPGAVSIRDIGPRDSVAAELAARAYNRTTAIGLGEFQSILPNIINERAAKLQIVEGPDLHKTIDAIYDFVAICSSVTEDELSAAILEHGSTGVPNEIFQKFRSCRTNILGQLFPAEPKGIFVRIASLRSRDGKVPYKVQLLFQSPRPIAFGDARPRTITEFMLDEFDIYGIGNYEIQP